jgi:very-short-patch-repair endonuclease
VSSSRKHRTLGAPDRTVKIARTLRKNMSLPEVLLWQELRLQPGGFRFRRQHPLGPYVLDFCCVSARLAIEIDGIAHEMGDRVERDARRDGIVLDAGFKTLRIPATEVLSHMDDVLNLIVRSCREGSLPNPPRNGEVARRSRDGGAGAGETRSSAVRTPSTDPSTASGPPPRSGEELR